MSSSLAAEPPRKRPQRKERRTGKRHHGQAVGHEALRVERDPWLIRKRSRGATSSQKYYRGACYSGQRAAAGEVEREEVGGVQRVEWRGPVCHELDHDEGDA